MTILFLLDREQLSDVHNHYCRLRRIVKSVSDWLGICMAQALVISHNDFKTCVSHRRGEDKKMIYLLCARCFR